VWDTSACEPVARCAGGHKYAIAGVAAASSGGGGGGGGGGAATAALDGGLALWTASSPPAVAAAAPHPGPVQCVLFTPGGAAVTGCGDGGVRAFSIEPRGARADGSTPPPLPPLWTLPRAHDDTVRALCATPTGLATAGHDGVAKVWIGGHGAAAPSLALVLAGHTALVYSVACSPDGSMLATGSEDGTARVWRAADGSCVGAARHPGCVWAVAFLPSGDLVTGASDGVARVWCREAERGSAALGEGLAAALAARDADAAAAAAAAASGAAPALPPGMKLEDASILATPGPPGKTVVVAGAGGGAVVWEAGADGAWARVGDVVAPPGSRPTHAGRAWDHVWDVDVADGAPPLKLPYDDGENPYDAADRFLADHNLPSTYREAIVGHIIAHGGAAAAAAAAAAGGGACADPFTGAGAYVPPPPGSAPPPGRAAALPAGVTGGGADPFTGGRTSAPPPPAGTLFDAPPPRPDAVADKAVAVAGAAAVAAAGGEGALRALVAAAAAREPPTATSLAFLRAALADWPPAALFPMLDVARLVALTDAGAAALAACAPALGRALAAATDQTPLSPPALTTACRCIANAARYGALRAWAASDAVALAAAAARAAGCGSAPAVDAAAAAVHNLMLLVAEAGAPAVAAAAPGLGSSAAALLSGGAGDAAAAALVAAASAAAATAPSARAALDAALEPGLATLGEDRPAAAAAAAAWRAAAA